jgi:hypothetical protein
MGLLKYAASRLKYVLKRLWAPTKAAAKRATPDKATVFSKRTAPLMLYDWQDSTPPSQTIGSCQQLLAKLITKKVRTVTALLTAWRVPPTVPMPAESPFQGVSPARRGRAGVVGRTHHAASLCGTDAPRLTSPILVLLAQQPRVRGQKPQPAWQENNTVLTYAKQTEEAFYKKLFAPSIDPDHISAQDHDRLWPRRWVVPFQGVFHRRGQRVLSIDNVLRKYDIPPPPRNQCLGIPYTGYPRKPCMGGEGGNRRAFGPGGRGLAHPPRHSHRSQ